jgi:hypothetical protein
VQIQPPRRGGFPVGTILAAAWRPLPRTGSRFSARRGSPVNRWERPKFGVSQSILAPSVRNDTAEGCRAAHGVADHGPPISTTWESDASAQQ